MTDKEKEMLGRVALPERTQPPQNRLHLRLVVRASRDRALRLRPIEDLADRRRRAHPRAPRRHPRPSSGAERRRRGRREPVRVRAVLAVDAQVRVRVVVEQRDVRPWRLGDGRQARRRRGRVDGRE